MSTIRRSILGLARAAEPTSHVGARHTLFCWLVVAVILEGLYIALAYKPFDSTISNTSATSALEAVKLMKDWGVWMASIQTATLAALGIFAKEGTTSVPLTPGRTRVLILTAMLNTAALFFSAWLLTSLSSVALRVDKHRNLPNYDVYNLPLFHFHEGKPLGELLTIGYIALCNHWLWALGVLTFGWLTVSLAIGRAEQAAKEKAGRALVNVPTGAFSLNYRTPVPMPAGSAPSFAGAPAPSKPQSDA